MMAAMRSQDAAPWYGCSAPVSCPLLASAERKAVEVIEAALNELILAPGTRHGGAIATPPPINRPSGPRPYLPGLAGMFVPSLKLALPLRTMIGVSPWRDKASARTFSSIVSTSSQRCSALGRSRLRVCPDTLGRITKFSKHEPN
jgi:hypothetical protein